MTATHARAPAAFALTLMRLLLPTASPPKRPHTSVSLHDEQRHTVLLCTHIASTQCCVQSFDLGTLALANELYATSTLPLQAQEFLS
jgi:hypothetical protein